MSSRSGVPSAQAPGDDLDGEPELDVGVQLDRDLVGADRPDRLVEVDAAAVELDAGLGQHRLGDVGRGDRAEQLALGARPWP